MSIRETISSQWDDLSDRAQAWAIRTGRIETNRWGLREEGYQYDTVTADSATDALEIAEGNVDRSNYDVEGTLWIDVRVRNAVTGEEDRATVTLEPDEPDCEDDYTHEWLSPYSVLGGLKENPGVRGHGGGVIIKTVCAHCGKYRTTDTWAQRPDTGEQGLDAVSYEDADAESLAWVTRRALRPVIEAISDVVDEPEQYAEGRRLNIDVPEDADAGEFRDSIRSVLPSQWIASLNYADTSVIVER